MDNIQIEVKDNIAVITIDLGKDCGPQMRTLLGQKPDLTLKELRAAVALDCTLPAIH